MAAFGFTSRMVCGDGRATGALTTALLFCGISRFSSLWRKGGAVQFGEAEICTDLQHRAELQPCRRSSSAWASRQAKRRNPGRILKECGSGALARIAEAASAPTPETLAVSRLTGSRRRSATIARSRSSIAAPRYRNCASRTASASPGPSPEGQRRLSRRARRYG